MDTSSATTGNDGKLVSLPTPVRDGYEFSGWYTSASGGTRVTTDTVFSGNTTVYAQWTKVSGNTPDITGTPSVPATPPVTTDLTSQGGAAETTAKPAAAITNGTAMAGVSSTVGNEILKQAVENKSENVVIAPEIKGEVSKTEVTIPASTVGQISNRTDASLTVATPVAAVTIPNGALDELSQASGLVKVSAKRTDSTVELAVTAGGKAVESVSGGMKVTVPVAAAAPGTVAVLVREDGTKEVVRKSAMKGENITIPLDGSAKLEILDNSKDFIDVPATGWEADAVAFASAHELLNGTSETMFSPESPMSRGMLAVVLHNLENNPKQAFSGAFADVDDTKWYECLLLGTL